MKKLIWVFSFVIAILSADIAQSAVLKLATISPDGSSWMIKIREGVAQIEKQTNNRVKFKIYPGGVMGSDATVLRKIRTRQLHGGALSSGALASKYPDNQVYNLPLMFNSQQEVDYVKKQMDPVIAKGMEDSGFVTFGLAGGGFAYLMSKQPIKTIEDVQQRKVWIPSGDSVALAVVNAFNVAPIPLSLGDVLPALQTGIIDTVTISPIGALAFQWHTQIKYITEMPVLYLYAFLAIDKKAFSKLTNEDQTIVRKVFSRVFYEIDEENKKNDREALAALKNLDIQFVKPTREALKSWEEKAKQVAPDMISGNKLSKKIFDSINAHLKKYRAKQAVVSTGTESTDNELTGSLSTGKEGK